MILANASRLCWAAILAVSATTARADVMQVDNEGARWVAGGHSAEVDLLESVTDAATGEVGAHDASAFHDFSPIESFLDDDVLIVPEAVVADTRLHAAGVPARYAAKIHELSVRFDLSPSLLEALVWQESRWRENAVSHAGARGLAQLMPGTARYLGVNPDDPFANLEGGARYLREQLDRFDGDLEKALAAYNAGPGRVIRANGIPNIYETKHYVAAILGRLASHARPSAP